MCCWVGIDCRIKEETGIIKRGNEPSFYSVARFENKVVLYKTVCQRRI